MLATKSFLKTTKQSQLLKHFGTAARSHERRVPPNFQRSVFRAKAYLEGKPRSSVSSIGSYYPAKDAVRHFRSASAPQKNPVSKQPSVSDPNSFEIQIESVDPLILRDQCQCERCVDPSSHQKLFQSSDIPSNIQINKIIPSGREARLQWKNDIKGYSADHQTDISVCKITDLLEQASPTNRPTTWDRAVFDKASRWWHWHNVQSSHESFYSMLRCLDDYGLGLLDEMPHFDEDDPVPTSTYGVDQIGAEIGPLRDSLYGRTWDVRSVVGAKNIAYTHQHLGLHMDLLYMTSPPNFQILHCLQASTDGGGESVFVDSFRAAEEILQSSSIPPEQHPLCTYPVPYHYHHVDSESDLKNNYYYRNSHSVIELDEHQNIVNVNWSPPFQAPLRPEMSTDGCMSSIQLRDWHRAAHQFGEIIERPDMQFEHLLKPGEAVIFNNRRVLHARKAFDVSKGPRWLKGAYIDGDPVWSKLRVLRDLMNGN